MVSPFLSSFTQSRDHMDVRRRHVNSEMHLQVSSSLILDRNATESDLSSVHTEKEVFKDDRALVIGISPDSVEKQKIFVEKQKLTVSPATFPPSPMNSKFNHPWHS